MEYWFESKKAIPYAKKSDLFELQRKTRLEIKTIQYWLENRRKRAKKEMTCDFNGKKINYSSDEICYMLAFFKKRNGRPNTEDFKTMTGNLQRTEKQLKSWFMAQRFKLKQKHD